MVQEDYITSEVTTSSDMYNCVTPGYMNMSTTYPYYTQENIITITLSTNDVAYIDNLCTLLKTVQMSGWKIKKIKTSYE